MTLIIGQESNLSIALAKVIPESTRISVRAFLKDPSLLDTFKNTPIKIVFNNFQASTALNDLSQPVDYISYAINTTAQILEKLRGFIVEKVIYTSSSSVYGNNKLCAEDDVPMPLSLHASLKLSNEYLITKYCQEHKIDYTLVRLFNMYGGDDKFSVISKIIRAYETHTPLNVINNGESIRDYVYIEDVVKIYQHLLNRKDLPIVNVGSGIKRSIKEILGFLEKSGFIIQTQNSYRDEIKVSIADNRLLFQTVGDIHLMCVEDYILSVLKQSNKKF